MSNIPVMSCIKSTEYSIHTRRCFITGEYCSQQTNIQKERQKLHDKSISNANDPQKLRDKGEINAFVIMNFSSVSDVVYEARIKPFIEGLCQHLYLDKKSARIACTSTGKLAHIADVRDKLYEQAKIDSKRFFETLSEHVLPVSSRKIAQMTSGPNAWDQKTPDAQQAELDELFGSLRWKADKESEYFKDFPWRNVSRIHVHRADSNPVSNYIICNRICQQMQMADLIIVDVSAESANVFYEFGLATAFHKLILPICFSDSFFSKELPEKLKNVIIAQQEQIAKNSSSLSLEEIIETATKDSPLKSLEKHIDCYPWRRKLFEHFGLRFQSAPAKNNADREPQAKKLDPNDIHYMDASIALSEKFGFSDFKYACFPYDEPVNTDESDESSEQNASVHDKTKIGLRIYNWLKDSYNTPQNAVHSLTNQAATQTDDMFDNGGTHPSRNNTLVVYTMDHFLNREEAGLCIINFYHNITRPMLENHCFCGDRVAVLGQPNRIWDDPKDSKTGLSLLYGVSDLIRIGMDQATYNAERKRIKTDDYLAPPLSFSKPNDAWKESAKKHIKTHIRNRCIPLSPENPIYVTQLREGIQQRIPEDVVSHIASSNQNTVMAGYSFFCLYHVMLDTLRYVNEVVVDLSTNSIQAMFWLGAAHGSNVSAVTVRHEMSEAEKAWSGNTHVKKDRPIFDLGGLWTAMLRYDEIDSFYKQLELIQLGIDQHAKLKLPEIELDAYEYKISRQLYHASPYLKYGTAHLLPNSLQDDDANFKPYTNRPNRASTNAILQRIHDNDRINDIQNQLAEKSRAESLSLESYYRDRFWRQLLRDNQLHLFLDLFEEPIGGAPKLLVSKWDMDAVAGLSHYLSKRKVIGKYQFDTLEKNKCYEKDAKRENFISIGSKPKPLYDGQNKEKALSLAEYINEHQKDHPIVRTMSEERLKTAPPGFPKCNEYEYRSFCLGSSEQYVTQYLHHDCVICNLPDSNKCRKAAQAIKLKTDSNASGNVPNIATVQNGYILPAQLLLWREEQTQEPRLGCNPRTEYKYHVSLVGVSGPATKALTALLVDVEQKGHIWGVEDDQLRNDVSQNLKRYLPLNTLQTNIRRTFYQEFTKRLGPKPSEDLQKAAHLSIGFLSTILPQYFLPFLSQSDEKRICNALEAFLRTIDGKNEQLFENAVHLHTQSILDNVSHILSEFRGVEALYTVQVSARTADNHTDSRKITNIELLHKKSKNKVAEPVISCLFVPPHDGQNDPNKN